MHAKAVAPPALTMPPEIHTSPTSTAHAGSDEPDHEQEEDASEAKRLKHNARVRFNRTIKRHLHDVSISMLNTRGMIIVTYFAEPQPQPACTLELVFS